MGTWAVHFPSAQQSFGQCKKGEKYRHTDNSPIIYIRQWDYNIQGILRTFLIRISKGPWEYWNLYLII